MIFTIGTNTFESLYVVEYTFYSEVLDGPGTGRTQAAGWPMVRDPQGIIKNVDLVIAQPDSRNAEFINLLRILDGFGSKDFEIVSFIVPAGTITQPMYGASYELGMTRLLSDGATLWKPLTVRFRAQKGIV